MSGDAPPDGRPLAALAGLSAVLLGLYLTLRGYHSFDGDQAYRLPLLLHRQDPQLFADDPFVRAFDAFNPHRGSLFGPRPGDPAARAVRGAVRHLRPDLRCDVPRASTAWRGDLARAAGRASAWSRRPGAGRQGRQHRHQPPLRGDGPGSADRLRAGLAGPG